jgi:hypothetical protein
VRRIILIESSFAESPMGSSNHSAAGVSHLQENPYDGNWTLLRGAHFVNSDGSSGFPTPSA